MFELNGRRIELGIKLLALPIVIGVMAVLALGIGYLIAAATVKYRDLNIIVGYTLIKSLDVRQPRHLPAIRRPPQTCSGCSP